MSDSEDFSQVYPNKKIKFMKSQPAKEAKSPVDTSQTEQAKLANVSKVSD